MMFASLFFQPVHRTWEAYGGRALPYWGSRFEPPMELRMTWEILGPALQPACPHEPRPGSLMPRCYPHWEAGRLYTIRLPQWIPNSIPDPVRSPGDLLELRIALRAPYVSQVRKWCLKKSDENIMPVPLPLLAETVCNRAARWPC